MTTPQYPPQPRVGRERKPIVRADYKLPVPVNSLRRTYSKRRKIDVLLFLENHRIPLKYDCVGWTIKAHGKLAGAGPVEDGFRRPYLREAAAYFGITNPGVIYKWWLKRKEIFGLCEPRKRSAPRWPELEARLYEEFCGARKARRLIQRTWFRRKARAIFQELYPENPRAFLVSNGWFAAFLRRHRISRRRVTHAATRVPEEILKYTNAFLQFIRRNSQNVTATKSIESGSDPGQESSPPRYPRHLIVNLDETPLPFEFVTGYTYEHKGSRSVQGKSERSGWGARQATLILSILADGSYVEELRPIIVFHGSNKIFEKESSHYHPGVTVKFNENAYNNEDLFTEWIQNNLAAYTKKEECLLVMDVANFHKTDRIKTVLKENNILTALIPPGLTSYLQPLDVGFNGLFKSWLREEFDLYTERMEAEGQIPEKWTTSQRRIMTTEAVGKAWQRAFSDENKAMVAGLFLKTGISVHPDGRDDHMISIKGIDSKDLRLDEWRRPLNVNAEDFVDTGEELGLPWNKYRSLKCGELKEKCKERGLRVSGNKTQMVQRLEDDDAARAKQQGQARVGEGDGEVKSEDEDEDEDEYEGEGEGEGESEDEYECETEMQSEPGASRLSTIPPSLPEVKECQFESYLP
ncbi:DDE superfamily endonuclease-domain-containing protein [Xylaria nigripes]|nr:DDE superfamily endonuclease-domain-containing protein [Xylaria nigripes]